MIRKSLSSNRREGNDQYEAFGHLVACKLKAMEPNKADEIMGVISNCLFGRFELQDQWTLSTWYKARYARGRKTSGSFQIFRHDLFHGHSHEFNHEPKMKSWASLSWCQAPIKAFFVYFFQRLTLVVTKYINGNKRRIWSIMSISLFCRKVGGLGLLQS